MPRRHRGTETERGTETKRGTKTKQTNLPSEFPRPNPSPSPGPTTAPPAHARPGSVSSIFFPISPFHPPLSSSHADVPSSRTRACICSRAEQDGTEQNQTHVRLAPPDERGRVWGGNEKPPRGVDAAEILSPSRPRCSTGWHLVLAEGRCLGRRPALPYLPAVASAAGTRSAPLRCAPSRLPLSTSDQIRSGEGRIRWESGSLAPETKIHTHTRIAS
ncbi:unnamed protein product [Diplocarpon coronariae]